MRKSDVILLPLFETLEQLKFNREQTDCPLVKATFQDQIDSVNSGIHKFIVSELKNAEKRQGPTGQDITIRKEQIK